MGWARTQAPTVKRLHAILLFLYIAACIAVMIGKEVWMAVNRELRL